MAPKGLQVHLPLAMLMTLSILATPSSLQNDGVVVDGWQSLDAAVDPAMFTASTDSPQSEEHSSHMHSENMEMLKDTAQPLEQADSSQQHLLSLESKASLTSAHGQLHQQRTLLEASSMRLIEALAEIDKQQYLNPATSNTAGASASRSASSRRLKAVNTTQKISTLASSSRVHLLASDAWNIAYGFLKVVRVGFVLLNAWFTATVTGTLYIDNEAMLQFASAIQSLQGELSDMLSAAFGLGADAVLPVS